MNERKNEIRAAMKARRKALTPEARKAAGAALSKRLFVESRELCAAIAKKGPIAVSLVAKGLTPGAAFVFLMVGPAINAASMTAVAKMIGARASVAYALVIALGAVLCGVVINLLPFDVLPQVAAGDASETLAWWDHLAAAVLVALVGFGLIKRNPKR